MTKHIIRAFILTFFLLFSNVSWAGEYGSYTNSSGTTVNVQIENTQTSEVNVRGCTPLSAKLNVERRCLFCPLFRVLYTAGSSVSTASFEKLARPFQLLVLIGCGVRCNFASKISEV